MTHTHNAAYPLTPRLRDGTPVADPAPPPAFLLLRFVVAMAVLLTAAAFPLSSFFTVSQIIVVGARNVSVGDILARSGLRVGQRPATEDARDAADRLRQYPWIAASRLNVSPAGRVTISGPEPVPQ